MRLEDKYPSMSDAQIEEERRQLEERDEWHDRWHPALGPQCGGARGSENDAYKL